jgi:hypothetical protein
MTGFLPRPSSMTTLGETTPMVVQGENARIIVENRFVLFLILTPNLVSKVSHYPTGSNFLIIGSKIGASFYLLLVYRVPACKFAQGDTMHIVTSL